MFGFLGSPCRSCASHDTHSTYRSFFCGLSGALRDDYTPAARFLVNRDSTFLSLLTASISPTPPVTSLRTCCNPISVPRPLHTDGLHSRFAAAVTVCGLATKLEDDRTDEKGLRKNAARFLGRAINPLTDRAISFLNSVRFPTADVVAMMEEQSVIESQRPDLITAATPTAEAYGTIFSEAARLADAPDHQSTLQTLGKNLGRLIYWKDAHDDREDDARQGRFNPLENSDEEEFKSRFNSAFMEFSAVSSLTGSFQPTIRDILTSTIGIHRPLIPEIAMAWAPDAPRKKEKKKDRWWDQCCHCDCCPGNSCSHSKGGFCDRLFDCGPGDTGCIDCGCCCSS